MPPISTLGLEGLKTILPEKSLFFEVQTNARVSYNELIRSFNMVTKNIFLQKQHFLFRKNISAYAAVREVMLIPKTSSKD